MQADASTVPAPRMRWENPDARTWVMRLAQDGADWVEVKRSDGAAGPRWRVDARLDGSHYRIGDTFATKEEAQGCALLLAMRRLPARRDALRLQLDAVPGAWWWEITSCDGPGPAQRSVFSSRVAPSAEAAERSARAAGLGAGWRLHVYGPGAVRTVGERSG
jgi:hypothetical protein